MTWSHPTPSSNASEEDIIKAKTYRLSVVMIYHDVVRFNVSMHDAHTVAVIKCLQWREVKRDSGKVLKHNQLKKLIRAY